MKSLNLANCTRRLGAPRNWEHDKDGICHTLEICDVNGWMVSAWQPTEKERQLIIEGHPIFLFIQGSVHPVVSLGVGDDDNK